MPDLDIALLRTFTVVAELKNFTAAGQLLGATQSAVSLRISKLEELTGASLLARTSRAVSLTPAGAKFLEMARACVNAHDAGLAGLRETKRTAIRLAVSDHAVGAHLSPVLAALNVTNPDLMPDVMVGLSSEMLDLFGKGEADAAIVRQDEERQKAIPLFEDPLVWVRSAKCPWRAGGEVPVVALRGLCGVKAATIKALDAARIPWRFSFLGGSVLALQAAVEAGLGLGVFGQRHAVASIAGAEEGLPPLPSGKVVMYTRLTGPVSQAVQRAFGSIGR
jgi:DNA-binding transcriptional LysR family regulator